MALGTIVPSNHETIFISHLRNEETCALWIGACFRIWDGRPSMKNGGNLRIQRLPVRVPLLEYT